MFKKNRYLCHFVRYTRVSKQDKNKLKCTTVVSMKGIAIVFFILTSWTRSEYALTMRLCAILLLAGCECVPKARLDFFLLLRVEIYSTLQINTKKQGKNFLEKQWKMNESFGSHRGHTNTSILTKKKKNYTVCPCLVLSSSFCLLATKGFIENVIVLLNDDEKQLDRKWYFILARMFHISHTWVTMSVERNKQKNISLTMNLESIRNTIWTFTRLILVIE